MKKLCMVAIILSFLAFPFRSIAEFNYNSKEFQSVVSQLDMQGHSKDDLATCSVKQTYYKEVAGMLNEGMSEDEIIQYYVDQYGQAALKEPGTDKNGLLAWSIPFVGLGAGVVIVGFVLKRIKRQKDAPFEHKRTWKSETEKEIAEKAFDEERYKYF